MAGRTSANHSQASRRLRLCLVRKTVFPHEANACSSRGKNRCEAWRPLFPHFGTSFSLLRHHCAFADSSCCASHSTMPRLPACSRLLPCLIEKKNENVILITHGFFMNVLVRQLRKRKRYEVFRGSTFVIQPLEKIRVMDREPHCGGCHHNCLLKNAGCMIGQDKARKAGLM